MKKEKNIRQRLWEETSGHCIYCGHPVTLEEMEIDHIVPKSLGGSSEYQNKVCSCAHCNAAKANRFLDDFLEENLSEKKFRKYCNRLDTLVGQGRLSEEKADILQPYCGRTAIQDTLLPEEPHFPVLTDWQVMRALAGILLGNAAAFRHDYGRQKEKQY